VEVLGNALAELSKSARTAKSNVFFTVNLLIEVGVAP
jgi:hypothetical protein